MRYLMLILALYLAIQPALLVAWGASCGSLDCPQSTGQEEVCGGCSRCQVADDRQPCCCASDKSEGDEVPISPPLNDRKEVSEFLSVVAPVIGPGLEVVERKTPSDALESSYVAPVTERSHNERLALHSILLA